MDGDIDFHNDFNFIANLRGFRGTAEAYRKYLETTPRTKTGAVPDKYGIGMGLVSLPLLLTARAAAAIYSNCTGIRVSPFAAVYPMAHIVTSIICGFIGVALVFTILKSIYGRTIACWGVACGVMGLSIGYYIWFDITLSHAVGLCFTSLFVLLCLRWRRTLIEPGSGSTTAAAFMMGLVLGIACAVRYTNIEFVLVPFVLAIVERVKNRSGSVTAKPVLISLGCAAVGWGLAFLPQMLAWKAMFGSFLTYSYTGEKMHPWPHNALHILFGLRSGLFVWTPLAFFCVAGLLLAAWRGRPLAIAGVVVWLATVWIYGSWWSDGLGPSFGMRGFCECTPFFCLGIAELIDRARQHEMTSRLLRAGLVVLVLFNLYLITCYHARILPEYGPFVVKPLFSHPDQWCAQFKKDYFYLFMPNKYEQHTFPLFTPEANNRNPLAQVVPKLMPDK
ncbi:hypothetical protein LLG95_10215 [bacterium]|nr:hypothetical protein [bacterium]